MIAGHDIMIFLMGVCAGACFIGGYLTGWHFRGKRIGVSNYPRVEDDTVREYPKPGLPPVDNDEFHKMIDMINKADDKQTYGSELREKTIRDRF